MPWHHVIFTGVPAPWQSKQALEQNNLIASSKRKKFKHDLHFLQKIFFPWQPPPSYFCIYRRTHGHKEWIIKSDVFKGSLLCFSEDSWTIDKLTRGNSQEENKLSK